MGVGSAPMVVPVIQVQEVSPNWKRLLVMMRHAALMIA
jgi:hypothetical protein